MPDYNLYGRYGERVGQITRDPFSWFTGNDYTITGRYGQKVGGVYRNSMSWLTGGDEYIITGKYGEKIGGFSSSPNFDAEIAGLVLIAVIVAIVITIIILSAPIFLGRKLADRLGPPWDALSLITLMYLVYAMVGVLISLGQTQPADVTTAQWQAQQQIVEQALFWCTTSFSLILSWKLSQAIGHSQDAWAFPAWTARLLPLVLGTGFSVNGLIWWASAALAPAMGSIWGPIYANPLSHWFVTNWDVGGWIMRFSHTGGTSPGLALGFGGMDLGTAAIFFGLAWIVNRKPSAVIGLIAGAV